MGLFPQKSLHKGYSNLLILNMCHTSYSVQLEGDTDCIFGHNRGEKLEWEEKYSEMLCPSFEIPNTHSSISTQ